MGFYSGECRNFKYKVARITTSVISIKNPLPGTIRVPAVEEIIREDAMFRGEIILTDKN